MHVDIGKVEVYTFHEHVGGHEHFLVWIVHHRTVVAHTVDGRGILVFISLGEMVDETEFT